MTGRLPSLPIELAAVPTDARSSFLAELISVQRVSRALKNRPDFVSRALRRWRSQAGINRVPSDPDKPVAGRNDLLFEDLARTAAAEGLRELSCKLTMAGVNTGVRPATRRIAIVNRRYTCARMCPEQRDARMVIMKGGRSACPRHHATSRPLDRCWYRSATRRTFRSTSADNRRITVIHILVNVRATAGEPRRVKPHS